MQPLASKSTYWAGYLFKSYPSFLWQALDTHLGLWDRLGRRAKVPAMGRPKNADAAKTRLRILQVAGEHFSRLGKSGASLRAIARDSAVTMSTVYYHFATKDLLYDATLELMYQELKVIPESLLAAARTSSGTVREILPMLVLEAFTTAQKHRPILRMIVRDAITHGVVPKLVSDLALEPVLGQAGKVLAAMTGRTERECRFALMSMNHLVARYALTNSSEIAVIAGGSATSDEAVDALVNHLVTVSQALLARVQ